MKLLNSFLIKLWSWHCDDVMSHHDIESAVSDSGQWHWSLKWQESNFPPVCDLTSMLLTVDFTFQHSHHTDCECDIRTAFGGAMAWPCVHRLHCDRNRGSGASVIKCLKLVPLTRPLTGSGWCFMTASPPPPMLRRLVRKQHRHRNHSSHPRPSPSYTTSSTKFGSTRLSPTPWLWLIMSMTMWLSSVYNHWHITITIRVWSLMDWIWTILTLFLIDNANLLDLTPKTLLLWHFIHYIRVYFI